MIWAIFGLLLICLVLYRLVFSPLARLPGPALCAMTRLPLMYNEFNANRRMFIHKLHLKYGPVVRIAPDEVAFATREAAKEIYSSGGSGYDKWKFYHLFSNFDRPNMFSTLEKGEHADLKKRFAERYTRSHVMSPDVASNIQDHSEAFVSKIAENLDQTHDVYTLLHCFSLDGITGHVFNPAGLHSLTDANDQKLAAELTNTKGLRRSYFRVYFPMLWRIYSKITGRGKRRVDSLVAPYVLKTAEEGTVASHTVLAKIRAVDAALLGPTGEPVRDWKYAASECMDHIAAGIGTTGDGLTFLLNHLSLPTPESQRIQARLHAELAQSGSGSTPAAVDALPYLDAVVKESLRVFSPIPMSFPRVVPEGGRTLDGVFLPGGTIVSCQPHTMHRLDTQVFPNPEEFIPERWLDSEGASERNQLFFAFAAGGRGCIGKHLALLEMKLLLKAVYSTYRTRVAPEMTALMEMDDQTISSRPKGQCCLLTFEKWSDV